MEIDYQHFTTAQRIFDEVAEHLLEQKVQAKAAMVPGMPRCAYRTPDGRKCALGALIPDEAYDPMIEGQTAQMFFENPDKTTKPEVRRVYEALREKYGPSIDDPKIQRQIAVLQALHDRIEPSLWLGALAGFALLAGLSTSVLNPYTYRLWEGLDE